jgi:hypothetical protein
VLDRRKRYILLGFLVLSGSISLAAEFPESYVISQPPPCAYDGYSYTVRQLDSSSATALAERYVFGDLTSSIYDSPALRRKIVARVYKWIDKLSEPERSNDIEFYLTTVKLRAEYTFGGNRDFILLKYNLQASLPVAVFIGLVKSSGDWYVLTDGFPDAMEDNFNKMLREHPGILQLDPQCIAALLLKLKYAYGPVAVVATRRDVESAYRLFSRTLPQSEWTSDELYVFPPVRELEPETLPAPLDSFRRDEIDGDVAALAREISLNKVQLNPPRLVRAHDSELVDMTVYNQFAAEVAEWRIVLADNGRFVRMHYKASPFRNSYLGRTFDNFVESNSPFFRANLGYPCPLDTVSSDRIVLLPERISGDAVTLNRDRFTVTISVGDFESTFSHNLGVLLRYNKEPSPFRQRLIELRDSLATKRGFAIDMSDSLLPSYILDGVIANLMEAGRASVFDESSKQHVKGVRIHDYTDFGIERYGGTRYVLPNGTVIVDVVTWME